MADLAMSRSQTDEYRKHYEYIAGLSFVKNDDDDGYMSVVKKCMKKRTIKGIQLFAGHSRYRIKLMTELWQYERPELKTCFLYPPETELPIVNEHHCNNYYTLIENDDNEPTKMRVEDDDIYWTVRHIPFGLVRYNLLDAFQYTLGISCRAAVNRGWWRMHNLSLTPNIINTKWKHLISGYTADKKPKPILSPWKCGVGQNGYDGYPSGSFPLVSNTLQILDYVPAVVASPQTGVFGGMWHGYDGGQNTKLVQQQTRG
eukprot:192385_1